MNPHNYNKSSYESSFRYKLRRLAPLFANSRRNVTFWSSPRRDSARRLQLIGTFLDPLKKVQIIKKCHKKTYDK